MNPTPEQRTAIETQDRALLVEAGAGTGKTWVLVQRFIHLLASHPDWPLESIVAITFTEKAAREMRTRLRQAIETEAAQRPEQGLWQEHRRSLERLQVSTIHSLCARILRENAIAAALDPQFQVLDEPEAELLQERAIREVIQVLNAEDHPALALLASLRVRDLQSEMVTMLARRGTLTSLFAELPAPQALLERWQAGLVEMRQALWQDQLRQKPELETAITELQYLEIANPDDKLAPVVMTVQQGCWAYTRRELVAAAQAWLPIKVNVGSAANWGSKEGLLVVKGNLKLLREAANQLEKQGALQEIGPADQTAAEHLGLWRQLWERLEQVYRGLKDENQALDFDDLELLTDRLLQADPRPPRLQAFLEGVQHLMVDEFQDTNLVQQRIVASLAPLDQPGRLFVVGDAKQSIYRFRQAQVSIFNRTAAEIEAVTGELPARLSTSFRTHASLVQALNALFDQVLLPQGEPPASFEARPGALAAQRPSPAQDLPPVEMLLLPSADEQGESINMENARIGEARWIAQRLLQLKDEGRLVWDKHTGAYRPFAFKDAAVLFRATTNLPLYETEFKAYGLPYLTISGRGYYDRPEVQDLIALLTALANPLDDLHLAAALRAPLFGLSDESLYRLRWLLPDGSRSPAPRPYVQALPDAPPTDQPAPVARAAAILARLWGLAGRVSVWDLLQAALEETGYETVLALLDGETGRQRANVGKFLALARQHSAASLPDFLARLRDLRAREAREGEALGREPESGAVQLMTIHAAKGLEFPVVVVADLGRGQQAGFGTPYLLHDPGYGLVCKTRDENGDWVEPAGYAWGKWLHHRMETAEQKRLLYVACTRTADLLILTGNLGRSETWLAEILAAWQIEPQAELNEDREDLYPRDGFTVRVFQPQRLLEVEHQPVASAPLRASLAQIPVLAQPLPAWPQPQPLAVTRLAELLAPQEPESLTPRPAIWPGQLGETPRQVPGYQVGDLVHRALADWQCLLGSEAGLLYFLAQNARRLGVWPHLQPDAVRRAHLILTRLQHTALFGELEQASRRYPELPFSLNSPVGVLHGVIDLLYCDAAGDWYLLDWKTEWAPAESLAELSAQHSLQLAAYARAVQQMLGVRPAVSICFLHPQVQRVALSAAQLEIAWAQIITLAGNSNR